MKHNLSLGRVTIFAAAFGIFSIAFSGIMRLPLPLIAVAVLVFTSPVSTRLVWALVMGTILETVSPFPQFVYLFSLVTVTMALEVIMKSYLSHRTIVGAAVVGALGPILFETALYGFGRLGALLGDGWHPFLDAKLFHHLVFEIIATSIVLVILVLLIRRMSPRLRGVTIGHF